jgi:hypothetical protein
MGTCRRIQQYETLEQVGEGTYGVVCTSHSRLCVRCVCRVSCRVVCVACVVERVRWCVRCVLMVL